MEPTIREDKNGVLDPTRAGLDSCCPTSDVSIFGRTTADRNAGGALNIVFVDVIYITYNNIFYIYLFY